MPCARSWRRFALRPTSRSTSTSFATRRRLPIPTARRRGGRGLLLITRSSASRQGRAPPAVGGAPFGPEAADVLDEFRPAVVSFHFGVPSPELLARVKGWGSKVFSSATTVDEARWLESRGVDGIIAQGLEAGGHRGMFLSDDVTTQVGTLALVPQIIAAVNRPVIAAGGIANAQGVMAALALGAAGVQIGTAYLLCPEATSSPVHRACTEERGRPSHGPDQRLHGSARPRDHEPLRQRGRPTKRSRPRLPVSPLRRRPLTRPC